jgi:hypothetical protein
MKKLLFLLIFIPLLSCEKNKGYDWECRPIAIFSIPGSSATPDTLVMEYTYLYDKTYSEALDYSQGSSNTTRFIQNNTLYQMETKNHCMVMTCPEY